MTQDNTEEHTPSSHDLPHKPAPTNRNNRRPAVAFDWTDWLPYLADSDIPEDKKQEWIETLWSTVLGFVDIGFDVKSSAETCGEAIDLKAALEAAVLNSEISAKQATLGPTKEEETNE